MNTISALIVDDEKPARDRVRFFLEDINEISIAGEAENGEEGLKLIEKLKPDLLILDIQMPQLDGFGMLGKCSYHPAVIFISAYDEYAINAFEVNAVDYLLKPYTKQRFVDAMNRVLAYVKDTGYWESKVSSLLESRQEQSDLLEHISVRKGNTYRVFDVNEIDYFKMDGGLLFLHSRGERYLIDSTLNQLEKRLPPALYYRIHRNAIANLKNIREILPWGQGRLALDFGTSGRIQVSKEKVSAFRKKVGLKI
ncbi:MAG: response regulator transcription factor [Spirochaetales bacterium]|nr:response regulator transcription factor [Spirochaetales bacterium]